MTLRRAVMFVTVVLGACGGGGSGDDGGGDGSSTADNAIACYVPGTEGKDSGCGEFTHLTDGQFDAENDGCPRLGGTVTDDDLCPTTDLLGCCHMLAAPNGMTSAACSYQDSTRMASELQAECEGNGGTWDTTP